MSGTMDLSLWRHCLVSAIFFRIGPGATNVTSPGIHDKMLCEVAYPFRNFSGWNVQVLEWKFHITFYNDCIYLSILGLKLFHVSERGPW